MDPIFQSSIPIAFAHRGGNEKYPENTLEAFQDAYKLGYRYLETDVHYTRGEELVAFHDKQLFRMHGIKANIHNLSVAERKNIAIDDRYHVPLLADLLTSFPNVYFNIDAKHAAAVVPLIETIKKANAIHRVCLASFSFHSLQMIRLLLPDAATALSGREVMGLLLGTPLIGTPPKDKRYIEMPTHIPSPHKILPVINVRTVRRLHEQGAKVFIWTINDQSEMERLLTIGVDGFFTDRLRVLKTVLKAHSSWD